MSRRSYTVLLYCLSPLMLVHALWRCRRQPARLGRWFEYLGIYPGTNNSVQEKTAIFHAVSVGEVHGATPLIRRFLLRHPGWRVVVTTSTSTGSERVRELFGASVVNVFLPYDLPGAVSRFFDHFSPALLIVMETELWPNLMHICRRRGIRLVLANARLSARSARRYSRMSGLVRDMLGNIERAGVQSGDDADRLAQLGLPADRMAVTGNLKYDMWFDKGLCDAGQVLRQLCFGTRPVLIAVSTREGEDEKVVQAFLALLERIPAAALILVPRHPARFADAQSQCQRAGLSTLRRSEYARLPPNGNLQVLIGDTMGDMPCYLSAADVAFVGGSLVNTGCQNVLEPAALGLPVITGPSRYNFRQASDALSAAGALREVKNAQELAVVVWELLSRETTRHAMAEAGRQVILRFAGASQRTMSMIDELLP